MLSIRVRTSMSSKRQVHLPSARIRAGAVGVAMCAFVFLWVTTASGKDPQKEIMLPSSKILLEPVPGMPRPVNSFPATLALHPSRRYVAILNNGYGTEESRFQQSIGILNLETDQLQDFPDSRFLVNAHQTYFLGLGFREAHPETHAPFSRRTKSKQARSETRVQQRA